MRVLIYGLPGSGKTTLASKLVDVLGFGWLNGDRVRDEADDWDLSLEGRERQAIRMKGLSSSGDWILDFVCPLQKYRDIVAADRLIYMDTILSGRFEDTNNIFEPGDGYVVNNFDYKLEDIVNYIQNPP